MDNPVIEKLIRSHQEYLELCRALINSGLAGMPVSNEQLAAINDEGGCEFSRIVKSGNVSFDSAFSEEAVVALHGTFHSLVALIITLVSKRIESSELGTYIGALSTVSDQLITVLRTARIHSI